MAIDGTPVAVVFFRIPLASPARDVPLIRTTVTALDPDVVASPDRFGIAVPSASTPPPAAFAWVWVAFVKLPIVGVVRVLFVSVSVVARPTTVSVVSCSVQTLVPVGVPVISRYVVPNVPLPQRNRLRKGAAVLPASTPVCASSDVLMLTADRLSSAALAPAVPEHEALVPSTCTQFEPVPVTAEAPPEPFPFNVLLVDGIDPPPDVEGIDPPPGICENPRRGTSNSARTVRITVPPDTKVQSRLSSTLRRS